MREIRSGIRKTRFTADGSGACVLVHVNVSAVYASQACIINAAIHKETAKKLSEDRIQYQQTRSEALCACLFRFPRSCGSNEVTRCHIVDHHAKEGAETTQSSAQRFMQQIIFDASVRPVSLG